MIQVSGFKPFQDRVLVKPLPKKKQVGSIIIADTVAMESEEGEVIAIGEEVDNVKVGSTVLYSSKAGWEIEVKEVKMKVLRKPEIEGEVC